MSKQNLLVWVLAGTGVLLAWASASGETITFNEFSLGTEVDLEYVYLGVVVGHSGTAAPTIVDISADASQTNAGQVTPPTATISPPGGLRIICPPDWNDAVVLTFVDPTDHVTPAYITQCSFMFVSDAAGADMGRIRAFDENNSLIDEDISTLGGPGNDLIQELETLSVSAAEIWRVEIDGFADVVADEITFDTPQVPEPATLTLLSVGSLLLLRRRRRKKNARLG